MKNIAVFFCSKSVEHDISVISAMQAIKGLKNYIQEITTNPNLETKILNIGDGLGITKLLSQKEKIKKKK